MKNVENLQSILQKIDYNSLQINRSLGLFLGSYKPSSYLNNDYQILIVTRLRDKKCSIQTADWQQHNSNKSLVIH